jgi:hypothetical protein
MASGQFFSDTNWLALAIRSAGDADSGAFLTAASVGLDFVA